MIKMTIKDNLLHVIHKAGICTQEQVFSLNKSLSRGDLLMIKHMIDNGIEEIENEPKTDNAIKEVGDFSIQHLKEIYE